MQFDFREELGKTMTRVADGAKIYVFGTGSHWSYIRNMFKRLVDIEIDSSIDGYIDNDVKKQGLEFYGKTIASLDAIDADNSVVLIAAASYCWNTDIARQLTERGFHHRHSFLTADCFMDILMRYEYGRLIKFKNRHRGERCFIIGNGPSLAAKDLELLNDTVCFATNKIFLAFDNTSWRPTYYCVTDDFILSEIQSKLNEHIKGEIFYACNNVPGFESFCLRGAHYFYEERFSNWQPPELSRPIFSEEPHVLFNGHTVTYSCIQLAAYMGFSEIMLLGVDHHFSKAVNSKGKLVTDGVDDHFDTRYDSTVYNAYLDLMDSAFHSAREYAEQHGIKILNATRGGKLEIFERVDFDSLFSSDGAFKACRV